jgi:hypothetical protein
VRGGRYRFQACEASPLASDGHASGLSSFLLKRRMERHAVVFLGPGASPREMVGRSLRASPVGAFKCARPTGLSPARSTGTVWLRRVARALGRGERDISARRPAKGPRRHSAALAASTGSPSAGTPISIAAFYWMR